MDILELSNAEEIEQFRSYLRDNPEVVIHEGEGYVDLSTGQRIVYPKVKEEKKEALKFPFLISTATDLTRVYDWFQDQSELAVDTETDGLKRFRKCMGLSFSDGHEAFYIPFLRWDGAQLQPYWGDQQESVLNTVRSLLSADIRWVGHNLVFDAITLDNALGVNIINKVFSDTALLHHTCISEDPPHGLKTLAAKFISPDAADAQKDLEDNVVAKGGSWTKEQKDFYMADTEILAKYAALDPYYTFLLHKKWYPEIEKQSLQRLWFESVLPLTKVMFSLNSTGLAIDREHFSNLKLEVEANIQKSEDAIVEEIADLVEEYEYEKVLENTKFTPRSEAGKLLEGIKDQDVAFQKKELISWYKRKKNMARIFNLDSKQDLAFLIYKVLKFPVIKETKSGAPAVDKNTLETLIQNAPEESAILKHLKNRTRDRKLLNTYVLPIIENQIDGRIYPQFNQIGTSSGRFTSSEPINFQTLPRDDLRVKRGFVADEGWAIVNADFSSLEPRVFAHMSDEPGIKKVYTDNLDLYSYVHILVMDDKTASAKEEDPNFLKTINKNARQAAKVYTLGFAYQMSEYKYAKQMNVSVPEAKLVKDKYFRTFKNLKKYQDKCNWDIQTKFYVTNIFGRKRRAKLIPLMKKLFPRLDLENKFKVQATFSVVQQRPEFIEIANLLKNKGKPIKDKNDFFYAIKTEFNNSSNFPIQGTAAELANASCIEFQELVAARGLTAKLCLQVHDEVTAICPKDQAKEVAECLQIAMEKNKVAKMLSVEMKAEPIIASNLAEAK